MSTKIVITGTGAVTPLGTGTETYWNAVVSGVCGIDEIRRIDSSELPVHRAGEVKDFDPRDFMPKPLSLDLEPYAQYAYASAVQAAAESGLDTHSSGVGVVMGTALHGIDIINRTQGADPKLLTKCMGNIAASQFAIKHGISGPCMDVSTACSSGGDAVTLAAMFLETGRAQAMVVMAGEAAICPSAVRSLGVSRALSPVGESRPFSADRTGFVMGEGGGALVLETEEHAKARGARVLGRLMGCANNTDGFHPVSPRPDGSMAAACMRIALERAGLRPEDIGYVNAHGTATLKGDAAESKAIRLAFGDLPVPVSSTKGATGHMMAAGGITELIACLQAVRTGILPVNLGYDAPDPECPLNIVTAENCRREISFAMSNSLGFGGQNSCLIVGRPD